uniref:SCAN box domain-containing protein n=1 Tax=Leptobrachium leishanense TaxID=445787 RepID=A0A8C5W7J8_9ANUR
MSQQSSKKNLEQLCRDKNISTKDKKKDELLQALEDYEARQAVQDAAEQGTTLDPAEGSASPVERTVSSASPKGDTALDVYLQTVLKHVDSADSQTRLQLILKYQEREERRAEREAAERRRQAERAHQLALAQASRTQLSPAPEGAAELSTPRPRAENFPTLDKDGDLDVFLRSFEKTCRQYQLPKEQWARYLTPGLKGPALEAFAELPAESDQDYEAIKATLQRRYNLTPEVYRKKFRSLQKRAAESYSAVVSHLTTLFRQWVRGLKIDTLESLEDLLIKEQFVQLCPPEIQEWLLDRKPETALEAGELADFNAANRASVDQSRGSPKGSSGWKPNSARPPDITAAAPPSVPVSAGEGGANPSSPGRSVRRRCFICDSTNHLLAACPQRKKPASTARGGYPSTSPSVLFVTRSEGSANVNQQAVIVGTQVSVGLRDTAAEVTLVRPGLVSPADFIPGRTLAVKGFGGVRPAVPMARVYLDWGAGRGLREVGVSENIPTDVLLGTDLGKLVSQYVLERDAGDLPRCTSGSTVGRAVCGGAQQDSWTGGQGMAVSQSAPAPGVPEVLCGSMRGQCDWEGRQGVSECPPAPESAGSLDPMRGEAAVLLSMTENCTLGNEVQDTGP